MNKKPMTFDEFIKEHAVVEEINWTEKEKFGTYPFTLVVNKEDGRTIIHGLVDTDIKTVFNNVCTATVIPGGFTDMFLTMSFPPHGDIKTDFIAIHHFKRVGEDNMNIEIVLKPYNEDTGEEGEIVRESETIDALKKQAHGLFARTSVQVLMEQLIKGRRPE